MKEYLNSTVAIMVISYLLFYLCRHAIKLHQAVQQQRTSVLTWQETSQYYKIIINISRARMFAHGPSESNSFPSLVVIHLKATKIHLD
jgi:hypothetical protein